MKDYILIVEGKNDYSRIKQIYPDMNIMITGGSAVSEEFLRDVKNLSKTHEIVIFTDPDSPGEKIRKKIQEVVPDASHIFINKKDAISKKNKKVGVEHVNKVDLINALERINRPKCSSDIDLEFLYDMGLLGEERSKEKRVWLLERLNIGYANGKQLVKKLNLFGYSKDEIEEICNDWEY